MNNEDKDFIDLRDEAARQQRPPEMHLPPRGRSNTPIIVAICLGAAALLAGMFFIGFIFLTTVSNMLGNASDAVFDIPIEINREITANLPIGGGPNVSITPPQVRVEGNNWDWINDLTDMIILETNEVRWQENTLPFREPVSFAMGELRRISVDVLNNSVEILTHDSSEATVVFTPPARNNFVRPTYDFSGGHLRIADYWRDFNQVGTSGGVLQIFLPQDMGVALEAVDINVVNGTVSIYGDNSILADDVRLEVVNGVIFMEDFFAGQITASTVNGTVNADNLAVEGNLALSNVNGGIFLEGSQISGLLRASTTTGSIRITNVDADMDRAAVYTVFGRVNID